MKILITIQLNYAQKKQFEEEATGDEITYISQTQLKSEKIALDSFEVIIGNIPLNRIKDCVDLKWIQLNNAGADDFANNIDLSDKVLLTNATGAYGEVIAEHMLALLFSLQKYLPNYYRHQQKLEWVSEANPRMCKGSRVLILGLGDIGREFAKRMKLLGAYVIGVKRRPAQKPDYIDELHYGKSFEAVLNEVDIVAMCLPQTEETLCIMNEERLKKLKKTAFLINVGRGSAVDTQTLTTMLEDSMLAGVAADVIDPEPLPNDHPLWKLDNFLLTPHIAGNYDVPDILDKIVNIALENLRCYKNKETLINQIDRKIGY